jgi:glycosyltransferase involved in cell wall biosynthesis
LKTSPKLRIHFFWVQFLFLGLNKHIIDFLVLGFLIISSINICWWIGLSIPILNFRDPPSREGEAGISVIVVFRNESQNLRRLLAKLNQQISKGPIELVLVNDRSDDTSLEIVEGFEVRSGIKKIILSIGDLPAGISPKKNAINIGVQNASFEKLLLVDADCVPKSSKWVSIMGEGLRNSEIVLGLGNYEKRQGILNKLIQFDTFITAFQFMGWAILGQAYMSLGRNWGYRKSLFIESSGFSGIKKVLGGDDDLLFQKLKKKSKIGIFLGSETSTVSVPETNYRAWIRQKIRHLKSGIRYNLKGKLLSSLVFTNHLFLIGLICLPIQSLLYLYLVWPIVLLRYIIEGFMIWRAKKSLGVKNNLLIFPLIEAFYYLSQLLAFFASLLLPNPKWKKEENFQIKP